MKKHTLFSLQKFWRIASVMLLGFITLMMQNVNAQVTSYSFAQSTGTYSALTGSTVVATATAANTAAGTLNTDVWTLPAGTIPFNFVFNGGTYTSCVINNNGYITFGATAPTGSVTTPISSTTAYEGAISAWGGNLNAAYDVANSVVGEVSYEVLGSAPNRKFVVQFKDWRPTYSISATQVSNFSFQIVLSETSNVVDIIYGPRGTTIGTGSTTNTTRQIGLRGVAGDYLNRTNSSTVAFTSSTAGITTSSTQSFNFASATAVNGMPPVGFTYTFTPPPSCTGTPTAGVVNSTSQSVCSGSTPAAISISGYTALSNITYQWMESPTGLPGSFVSAVGGSGNTTTSFTPPAFAGIPVYYACQVTCVTSGLSDISDTKLVEPFSAPTTQVSNLNVGSLNAGGASLTWTNGNGTRRMVIISDSPIVDPVSGNFAAVTANAVYSGSGQQITYDNTGSSNTISGLICNTLYYVKVYDYNRCGAGPYDYYYNVNSGANATTFTTPSATSASLPSNVDFTGFTGANLTTAFPDWREATGNPTPLGTTSSWISSTVFGSGNTTARINLLGNTKKSWIIGPRITLTANSRVVFNAAITDGSSINADPIGIAGTDDFVQVMISTDACGQIWTPLYTYDATTAASLTNVLTSNTVDLSAYTSQTVHIAFYADEGTVNDAASYDFHIGDVRIELIPSCEKPSSLVSSSITTNSAVISWTASTSLPANGYSYYYSTSNTSPNAATIPSGSVAAGVTTASLSSLNSGQLYYYWVKANCGTGDESLWTNASTFTTVCTSYLAPWVETFTGTTDANPSCWTQSATTGGPWQFTHLLSTPTSTAASVTDHTTGVGINYAWLDHSSTDAGVIMNAPIINVSNLTVPQLRFYIYSHYSGTTLIPVPFNPTYIEAYDGAVWSSVGTVQGNLANEWTEITYDLSSHVASGNIVQLRIRGESGGSTSDYNNDILIDDFEIRETPPPTWNGVTSTDWATASNWTPAVVPATSATVIIPSGTPNAPIAATFTVATGGTVTLNSGANLTVTGAITNDGTVTLQSGATLVQGSSSTVAGTGVWNAEQAVIGGNTTSSDVGRFYYMGSPVAAATSAAFNAAGANRAWTYNEAAAAFTEITDNTTSLNAGQGYGTIFAANETRTFTGGLINNGAITISGLTKTGTAPTAGFNMVSNPYPSYLDWDAVTRTNVDPTIWFQTKTAGGTKVFDTYNATSGLAVNNSGGVTNQYIAPTQGFWVLATGAGSLGLDNTMRSHQAAGSGLKAQASDFPAFVRLKLIDGESTDETIVFFHEDAKTMKDAFDSEKMFVNGASQLYSQVDESQLSMNGLQFISGMTRSVPLTVKFIADNDFTFNAKELNMASGMVFLEDKLNQTMHNLSNNDTYTFTATAGTNANRFVLHFQDNGGLSIAEATKDAIAITADLKGNVNVTLSNDLSVDGTITVLDAAGRVVSTKAISNANTQLQLTEKSGLYFVRVSNGNAIATEKIIIAQ